MQKHIIRKARLYVHFETANEVHAQIYVNGNTFTTTSSSGNMKETSKDCFYLVEGEEDGTMEDYEKMLYDKLAAIEELHPKVTRVDVEYKEEVWFA